ncbi:MAG: PPOX class F420-dependent oxidoreductase [Acidobacteria bacterium]|nr:PPOX class F420-dependent oxidoreductase [Acidobacteriota bacterium]
MAYATVTGSILNWPFFCLDIGVHLNLLLLALYLLATLSYLYVLPFDAVSSSKRVAADSMKAVLGPVGGTMISLLILSSVTGAANGMTLSGSRAYYAMARDGLFFPALQRIHPRYGTPTLAILVQGVWASVLALTGRYDQLFTYVIFAAWIFYAMTVAAVIVLRRKHPEWRRPYSAWGYPVVPALFALAAMAFVVNTLLTSPRESAWGLAIVLTGIPTYFWWWHPAAETAQASTLALLGRHRTMNLVTFRKNGISVATPVWFAEEDGKLYVPTWVPSGKVKRIRNNPKVQMAPRTAFGKVLDAKQDGVARVLGMDEEAVAIHALGHKYGWQMRVGNFFWKRFWKLRGKHRVYLEILPASREEATDA